ncbi:hypothetical protein GCM10022407_06440 [Hymenobacter antarcticus]|uniref:Tetratricopeptide repeat-containing protein n=2 Tax=Hymenobacter antarcticus TaxID=486270 RepID=A0ABP7PAC8_9BACT
MGLLQPVAAQTLPKSASNLLPRYGNMPKRSELLVADQELLNYCDQKFPGRPEAAKAFSARGWDYMRAQDPVTAIKRFNQAWLLDSTDAGAFWGFGVVMGQRQQYDESLGYFQTAYRLDGSNKRLLVDMATTRLELYAAKKEAGLLDGAIHDLQLFLADSMDAKTNALAYVNAYSKLGAAYTFKQDYASAWKYVYLVENILPGALKGQPWLRRLKKEAPRK